MNNQFWQQKHRQGLPWRNPEWFINMLIEHMAAHDGILLIASNLNIQPPTEWLDIPDQLRRQP